MPEEERVPSIAIIGTGWGARVQVPAFREAGFEVAAIAGSDGAKTARTARELGVAQAFDDWRKIVDLDVDLVSVVTPPHLHREMAIEILQADKHLLLEKPTALDATQAREILDVSRRRPEQIAIIDHELRFLPTWIDAKNTLPSIGELRYIEMRYSSPGRGDRQRAWNWWSDAAMGGGIWGAVGSHLIDATRYFAGEIDSVRAILTTLIDTRPFGEGKREVTSDDHVDATLTLASGTPVSMSLSVVAGIDEPTLLTFHGERGSLRLVAGTLLRSRDGRWEEISKVDGGHAGDSDGGFFGTGTKQIAAALCQAIEGDREALSPAATIFDGLRQQQVLDAGRASSERGGVSVSTAVPND